MDPRIKMKIPRDLVKKHFGLSSKEKSEQVFVEQPVSDNESKTNGANASANGDKGEVDRLTSRVRELEERINALTQHPSAGSVNATGQLMSLSSNIKNMVNTHTAITKDVVSTHTAITKDVIHSFLEPVPLPKPRKHRRHRGTVYGSNSGMQIFGELNGQAPEDLIGDIMSAGVEDTASAEYLAREFGGFQPPEKFSDNKKTKKTLKGLATDVKNCGLFVRRLSRQSSTLGKEALEHLPLEFSRLDLEERKSLARLLSWDGLKEWGFDSFEVEKLSAVAVARSNEEPRNSLKESLTSMDFNESEKSITDFNKSERSIKDGDQFIHISQRGCPIVLVGWALLASPHSQLAMAKNVNDEELIKKAQSAIEKKKKKQDPRLDLIGEDDDNGTEKKDDTGATTDAWNGGYFFCDQFDICPKHFCCFLRKVEKEYMPRNVNPYHNNIHAADVIQSTHAIIQMGGADMQSEYLPIEIYSTLVAAALHDVKHPGVNNNYQINAQTELSLTYNDESVLENMHASRASHLLKFGEQIGGDSRERVRGIMGNFNDYQRRLVRSQIVKSILHTDMSRHFAEVATMINYVEAVEDDIDDEMEELQVKMEEKDPQNNDPPLTPPSLLSCIGREKNVKIREKLLGFILHLADISNPTKAHSVSLEWSDAAYDEFFLQGDKELAQELPISPLCDRKTTNRIESQIGFIAFVVKPAFLLLSRCVPKVKSIVNQLDENLKYWESEKAKAKEEREKREAEMSEQAGTENAPE